ncbi:S-adenosylmethionine synthetase N-terminal domain-containing protein, partial [Bacillus pumilus]|uniref:S-adenosylmethionine synthetase N-terminal domain-containing protein n=1 Tax=Bacillus pumilus TaxID=1408 RepID=UPI0034D97BEF
MVTQNPPLFTSQSLTQPHPHKISHQISHTIFHQILNKHPNPPLPSQTSLTTPLLLLTPQITTSTYLHIPNTLPHTINQIRYTPPK